MKEKELVAKEQTNAVLRNARRTRRPSSRRANKLPQLGPSPRTLARRATREE